MKFSFHISLTSILLSVIACTTFQEEDVPDGLSVDAKELVFSKDGDSQSLIVRSGARWEVASSPKWISLQSIDQSEYYLYEWSAAFSATANSEYDREGLIIIKAGTETKEIPVTQEGKKGKYVPVESITLELSSLVMQDGESITLAYTILPNNASDKTVSWTSSDESVASVTTSGQVSAVSIGSAIISVETNDGHKKAECKVTVKPIDVSSLTLNKTSITLFIGESEAITATITPSNATDKTITWTSSRPSVATVTNEGRITAVGVGTTAITAKAGDKTATCSVVVKPIEVSSITLNKSKMTLDRGKTELLTAQITPDNATDKTVTWSSSNSSIVTVSQSGVVTAVQKGTAVVQAKCGEKTAQCEITVVVPVESLMLNKESLDLYVGDKFVFQWTVYPEDASDKSVSFSSSNENVVSVSESSGEVRAINKGNATIFASAGSITVTCPVTVQGRYIKLSEDNVSVDENGSTFTISVDANLEYYMDLPSSASGWISASELGNDVYSFTVAKNESFATRSTVVSFKAETASISAQLTITQKAKVAPDDQWDGTIASSYYSAGSGSKDNPYVITTCSQVARLAQEVNSGNAFEGKYFTIVANLDFASQPFTPIGDENHPFSGNLDGGGKKLVGISEKGSSYLGLFGRTSGASINDLYIRINPGSSNSQRYLGGVVGYASNTTITNCCTYGFVNGDDCTGGLVGYADAGVSIRNCYSTCQNGLPNIHGSVGGLVGYNCGEIINSHFYGSINATSYQAITTGGVVGYNHTTAKMSYCYFMSSVISIMSQISYSGTLNWGTCDHCGSYNLNGYISGVGQILNVLNSWVSSHQTSDHFYREWTGTYPNFVYD